jgi:hypothetical protein
MSVWRDAQEVIGARLACLAGEVAEGLRVMASTQARHSCSLGPSTVFANQNEKAPLQHLGHESRCVLADSGARVLSSLDAPSDSLPW